MTTKSGASKPVMLTRIIPPTVAHPSDAVVTGKDTIKLGEEDWILQQFEVPKSSLKYGLRLEHQGSGRNLIIHGRLPELQELVVKLKGPEGKKILDTAVLRGNPEALKKNPRPAVWLGESSPPPLTYKQDKADALYPTMRSDVTNAPLTTKEREAIERGLAEARMGIQANRQERNQEGSLLTNASELEKKINKATGAAAKVANRREAS